VTAALYRDAQIVLARELHRRDDVGRAGAAGDQRRPVVNQCIPDGARLIVTLIAGEQQRTAQPGAKGIESVRPDRRVIAGGRNYS